jgi:hypothetical protein
VRRIHRRGLQRLDHDRLDHIVTDRARRARARRVDQAFQPVGGEPVTPLRDRDLSQPSSHGPSLDITACARIFDQPAEGVWGSDHFGVVTDLAVAPSEP